MKRIQVVGDDKLTVRIPAVRGITIGSYGREGHLTVDYKGSQLTATYGNHGQAAAMYFRIRDAMLSWNE